MGVDPMRKGLMWAWLERVRGVEIAEVLRGWKGQGVVGVGMGQCSVSSFEGGGGGGCLSRRIPLR